LVRKQNRTTRVEERNGGKERKKSEKKEILNPAITSSSHASGKGLQKETTTRGLQQLPKEIPPKGKAVCNQKIT